MQIDSKGNDVSRDFAKGFIRSSVFGRLALAQRQTGADKKAGCATQNFACSKRVHLAPARIAHIHHVIGQQHVQLPGATVHGIEHEPGRQRHGPEQAAGD